MNTVAEAALRREVVERAAEFADSYQRAAEAMRSVARPRLADLVDEIATHEASTPEPVETRRIDRVSAPTFEAIRAHARRVG